MQLCNELNWKLIFAKSKSSTFYRIPHSYILFCYLLVILVNTAGLPKSVQNVRRKYLPVISSRGENVKQAARMFEILATLVSSLLQPC